MDALTLAQLFREYGGWGVAAAACLFAAWALKGWHACAEARIADAKSVTAETTRCITNSSQHIATSSAAIAALTSTGEQRLRATELLTAAVGRQGEDLRDFCAAWRHEIRRGR